MTYSNVVISSGHGKYVRGACGILDEVNEARRVVNHVATLLEQRGVVVDVFHDDTSESQSENLNSIVAYHNGCDRELDVSVHFNAYVETTKPMGTEVLYLTQPELAGAVSAAISDAGEFINRGAKKRTDLAFLNGCDMPAILIEVCFVDSSEDAELYQAGFEIICDSIAEVLGGSFSSETIPPDEAVTEPVKPLPTLRLDVEVTGDITIIINGVPVT